MRKINFKAIVPQMLPDRAGFYEGLMKKLVENKLEERSDVREYPEFNDKGMTKGNWICHHPEDLKLGNGVSIGAFTFINARYTIEVGDNVKIGSHCSIESWSDVNNVKGRIVIKRNVKIGNLCVIEPGVTTGANSTIRPVSLVTSDVSYRGRLYGGGRVNHWWGVN